MAQVLCNTLLYIVMHSSLTMPSILYLKDYLLVDQAFLFFLNFTSDYHRVPNCTKMKQIIQTQEKKLLYWLLLSFFSDHFLRIKATLLILLPGM